MALGNNSGKFTYVNIKKGQLIIKKGNEVLAYNFIEGTLTDISIREEEFEGVKYKKLCLNLVDGDETYQLQMRLDSGYGRAFCNMIKNVDVTKLIKITPTYKESDGKKQSGMFINQNGVAIKWFYTKDTPHELPPMESVVFKGQTQWDNSKQQIFYEEMLLHVIKPMLPHAAIAGPVHQIDSPTDINSITEPVDDLPF